MTGVLVVERSQVHERCAPYEPGQIPAGERRNARFGQATPEIAAVVVEAMDLLAKAAGAAIMVHALNPATAPTIAASVDRT